MENSEARSVIKFQNCRNIQGDGTSIPQILAEKIGVEKCGYYNVVDLQDLRDIPQYDNRHAVRVKLTIYMN